MQTEQSLTPQDTFIDRDGIVAEVDESNSEKINIIEAIQLKVCR